ncbi:hypothetical protein O7627_26100 [Solwaraspora sp. WMMD1047]|uniref:hypothetical protein n=1 Tax=Solwaraspora sp. WMMD1047 TaxID=3016102 RepID=UPI002417CE41|nr:hypothetical protein [Solwaraspora sp. WMMD1047]MDG4832755.1 hypothetical protein [Solwaraspora sp. WMMD1047]
MSDPHISRPPTGDEPGLIDLSRDEPPPRQRYTGWRTLPGVDQPATADRPADPGRPTGPARGGDGPGPDGAQTGGPSRRKVIVLGAALLVGLAGAATLGTAGWRIAAQKDAELRTPATVAGLTLDDSERAAATADYLRTGFAADIALDRSVGAVYADPAAPDRSVLLFGGTTLIWQPERDLDRLFELVADDDAGVTGLREMPAGEFGGVLKCGTTDTPEGELPVCGWADHGSVAMAMFPGRDVDQAGELMREIRDAVQTRN